MSIFMPVYNGQDFLDETIKNVLSQTYKNFELVCVDDSSTDSSTDIIKKYSAKDKRIILYEKENGGNVPKSFNYVLPKLKGDFYLYMSQDDKLSEDLLEEEIKCYKETGCDIAVPTCKFVGDSMEDVTISLSKGSIISGKEAFVLSLTWKIHGFNLVKMSLIKDEICDEEVFNSDEFLTRRFFFKANLVASSGGVFFYYRNNPKSITKNPKAYRVQSLLNNEAIRVFIEQHKEELPRYVGKLWKKVIINKIYWTKKYIKTNSIKWSEDDQKYVNTVYYNCLKSIALKDLFTLASSPRVFLKGLVVKF